MRIMNCIAICQVAGFSARFQNPEGIAAVSAFESPRKPLTGVFLGDNGYIYSLTDPQHVESTGTVMHRCPLCQRNCQSSSNCCFSDSTCINQLAPGSGCGGGSGSGAGITDDDTSGMPKHVPLVTYFN